jgi:hypothetical protein
MKVLFLSHYRNNDEFGVISQNYILSMITAGIDMCCRYIQNTNDINNKISPTILQLEQNEINDCDICVQFLNPEYIVGSKKFKKNIGLFNLDLINEHSFYTLNLLDQVWVMDNKQKTKLLSFCKNVVVIPPPSQNIKDQLQFLYNSPDCNDLNMFSLQNVGLLIKEVLSA